MNFAYMAQLFPKVLEALPMTMALTIAAMFFGSILGFLLALSRLYKVPFFNSFAKVYLSIIRGVPLVVQIYIAYYVMPGVVVNIGHTFGLHLQAKDVSALAIAIIAFSLDQAAYLSETFRAALESIDAGQMEAASSVGMTHLQGMFKIVIPQAIVVALPSFGNLFLGMIKGSSLAYMVGLSEIMGVSNVEAAPGLNFIESYLMISVLYWVTCSIFEKLFRMLETRLKKFRTEVAV